MGDKNAPKCSEVIIKSECECRVNFTLDENFKAPVYFYYGLSKYFQNHRRYVPSKDDTQFNDTFKLFWKSSPNFEEPIDLIQTDIAWPTDKVIKLKDYAKSVDNLDPNNNGHTNEHLIVWMRTAAFPSFRKLWGRINHDQSLLWRDSLPKGNYELRIDYSKNSIQ